MSNIKTSAINDYNAAIVKQSGRVGTVRYYTKNGLTYVRAASNSQVTNNRTNAQMTQRLTFASLAALYSTMGSHLKGAFPNKAKNQSDYNAFMQANQGEGVYMTKQSRTLGYSVALPVVVASGKLMGVTSTVSGGNVVSDLNVTSTGISTSTIANAKVSELSAAIIAGNDGWNYGDQLTLIVLRQSGNYCKPQYMRIVLDREDETLVNAFGTFSVVSGCLAVAVNGNVCAGFVHSTTDGGMSFCKLAASDSMLTIINGYLTDDAFATASASYGTSSEKFLVPTKIIASDDSSSGTGTGNGNNSGDGTGSTDSPATTYTVTLTASPANGGSVGSNQSTVTAGDSVHITASANSGYTFTKWSDDNTSASRDITVNSNISLTAIFTATGSGEDDDEEDGGGEGGNDDGGESYT